MDRDDAAFVADVLDKRIAADRETLDRLAETSRARLADLAARISILAADWLPAVAAVRALEAIARQGGEVLDLEKGSSDPLHSLQIFVDKMRELAIEPAPVPRNRFERRRQAARLPRADRELILRSRLVH